MDLAHFNASVCNVVQLIPRHRVTTCAHIAKLIGFPTQARQVSKVVRLLAQVSPHLPWHRVISTSGIIASHKDFGSMQIRLLEAEGVRVLTGGYGESRVMLDLWGWFPEYVDVFYEVESSDEWGS